MRVRRLPLLLAAAALALTGCTTGSDATGSGAQNTASSRGSTDAGGAEAGAFPVTIRHAFGSTTVERAPERVATLGWSDQDMAVSLGVVPVGSTTITYGGNAQGSTDFFDAAVEELGGTTPVRYDDTDGIPFAEVARVRPDLILATNSGLTRTDYDRLSTIAPVVAYPGKPFVTPWRTSLATVGRALGRPERAARVQERAERRIEAAAATYDDLRGATFMLAYLSTTDLSTVGVYGSEDTRVAFLRDFGLRDAPSVAQVVKPGAFYGTVSAERSGDLASDVVLAFTDSGARLRTFATHPLIGRIPAFRDRHVYAETDTAVSEALTNPTPLSIPVVIEKVLPELDRAVQGS